MSRRANFIKRSEIMLDATLPVPLYKQLYERLRGEILAGQLARELGISRSTTVLAYTQLLLEGYLESRVGQGTVVARDLPGTLLGAQKDQTLAKQTDALKSSPTHLASCVRPLQDMPYPERIEEPALDLFPSHQHVYYRAGDSDQLPTGSSHSAPCFPHRDKRIAGWGHHHHR